MRSNILIIIFVVLAFTLLCACFRCQLLCPGNKNELYQQEDDYQPGDYHYMSHLPWATPPTGIGALGEREYQEVQYIHPQKRFSTGKVPISCPPDGVRIYETGNAMNPNVYSTWGVIHPDEITY